MVKDSEPHVNGFQHVGVWGFRGFVFSGLGFGVWVAFHSLGFAFEVSCCES